jgi:hypothetical protein
MTADSIGMCQKWAILLDSLNLVQAQNCQMDLTHALNFKYLQNVAQKALLGMNGPTLNGGWDPGKYLLA